MQFFQSNLTHPFILILVFLSYQLFLLLLFFSISISISIFFISFMFFHVLSLLLLACLLFLHSLDSPQINTWITIVWNQWFSVPFSVSFSVFISFLVVHSILFLYSLLHGIGIHLIWCTISIEHSIEHPKCMFVSISFILTLIMFKHWITILFCVESLNPM